MNRIKGRRIWAIVTLIALLLAVAVPVTVAQTGVGLEEWGLFQRILASDTTSQSAVVTIVQGGTGRAIRIINSAGVETAALTGGGDMELADDLTVSGDLIIGNGTPGTGGGITAGEEDLYVEGGVEIDGSMDIGGSLVVAVDVDVLTDFRVGNGTPDIAQDGEDAYIEGTLEVDGASEFDAAVNIDGAVDMDSTLDVAGATILQADVTQAIDLENVGALPTVDSEAITYVSTGAVWTVGAGEIWFVYALYCEVTTNFDCTGNDCTLIIGDGNDTDGFLVLTDAEMQAADAEYTGAPAGWHGLHTDSMGAYLSGLAPFVYDGTDTIDITIGGTDPAAGEATCYVVYQRIQ